MPMTPLEELRHSASHILATALLRVFPDAKLDIGPPTDTGFYYDVDLDHKLTAEDLAKIEAEMKKVADENQPFLRKEVSREEATEIIKKIGQERYKLGDHRKLGRDLKLFVIDDDVGQGLILWTPNGAIIRQELQTFISEELRKQGYSQVFTPHIGKLELYKTSGHFPYYKESQFSPVIENESLAKVLAENCPCGDVFARLEAVSGHLRDEINQR